MISRQHRFHGYGSLRYVYKNGQTVRGPIISIKYAKNPKRNTYRAAVVVSKKVDKSAVARNRIRRRIYETLRGFEPMLLEPHDIVITVFNEELAGLSPDDLKRMIHAQLKQANILKKPVRDKIDT